MSSTATSCQAAWRWCRACTPAVSRGLGGGHVGAAAGAADHALVRALASRRALTPQLPSPAPPRAGARAGENEAVARVAAGTLKAEDFKFFAGGAGG
jgi:hypothetical protein